MRTFWHSQVNVSKTTLDPPISWSLWKKEKNLPYTWNSLLKIKICLTNTSRYVSSWTIVKIFFCALSCRKNAEWDSSAPPFRRWTFRRWNVKSVLLWNVTKVQNVALPSSGKRVSARISLAQWFPNCGTRTSSGTRRPSRWYTNRPTKNILTATIFTCRVLLINSSIFV